MSEELSLAREPTKAEMAAIHEAEKTLLPCPFCGSGAIIEYVPRLTTLMPDCHGAHYIECAGCSASIAGGPKLSEAVAAWNRRA
jgi:Lar family restriction alleviation protein